MHEQIVAEMASQQRMTWTSLVDELRKLEAERKAAADSAEAGPTKQPRFSTKLMPWTRDNMPDLGVLYIDFGFA